MIRYVFKTDDNMYPITLYYIDDSDFSEKRFDKNTGKWVPTDRIYYALISGDLDYEEVSLDIARTFAPEAFKEINKNG
jgi:hypothetical protein